MEKVVEECYQCEGANNSPTVEMFGYTICKTCKAKLGLFQDLTIQRHVSSFEKAKEIDPSKRTYEEEIAFRLAFIDKDYISKQIKLLHIQDRLKGLK